MMFSLLSNLGCIDVSIDLPEELEEVGIEVIEDFDFRCDINRGNYEQNGSRTYQR